MLDVFYIVSFAISVLVMLGVCIICACIAAQDYRDRFKLKAHKKFTLSPFQTFIGGIFIAAVAMFFPIYYNDPSVVGESPVVLRILKSLLLSAHNTIRLFILDGEFTIVSDALVDEGTRIVSDWLYEAFSAYASVLFVIAPVLSAAVVLTFFKNARSAMRYAFSFGKDIYIMSELNERSVALAEDILENATRSDDRIVVFTDVFERNEEENYELVSRARKMGAICFRRDITELSLKPFGSKIPFIGNIKRKIYFIGHDEDENVSQALSIISVCRSIDAYNTERTEMYVFSNSVESEVLLNSADNGKMKVRRINESRSRAIRILREHSIFKDAIEVDGLKVMNVAIVGLGGLGTELLKTVVWAGQMYGYELNIQVFSILEDNEEYIRSIAPELVKYNGLRIAGEPYYKIVFHDGVDVKGQKFLDAFEATGNITTVFVTLGDDELNLETAMRMRMQFGRLNHINGTNIPPILAVVYSNLKTDTIMTPGGLKSIKGEDYGIGLVGDFETCYTVDAIEQKDLEDDGLKCHLRWSSTAEDREKARKLYEKFEYYRRSSISEALHAVFRQQLGLVPGANGGVLDDAIAETEHKRWNAFMRAEGYVGGPVKDDIAKTHKDLIPYGDLSDDSAAKDMIVISEQ